MTPREKEREVVRIDLTGNPMFQMRRYVYRKGIEVQFQNAAGGCIGDKYVYRFPNEAVAKRFERLAKRAGKDGMPSAIEPVQWTRYRVSA